MRKAYESKVTIPAGAHPLARLCFELMRKTNTTYLELEWRSGVLLSSIKAWRSKTVPSLVSMEAVLGVWGYRLVPTPPLCDLPEEVLAKLEEVGQHFLSDEQTLAAAIVAGITSGERRHTATEPAPLVDYGRPPGGRPAKRWKHESLAA